MRLIRYSDNLYQIDDENAYNLMIASGDIGAILAISFFPVITDDVAWQAIRQERDGLLSACDWTQFADSPLSDGRREMWRMYRQALRDLPQIYHKPEDVLWPEKPE